MRARPFWTFNKPNVERSIEKQGTWLARRGRDHLAALNRGAVDIAYGRQGDIAYSNLATTQLRTCSEGSYGFTLKHCVTQRGRMRAFVMMPRR